MKNITVSIPDRKLPFFKDLIENLGFDYTETPEQIPLWQQKEVQERYEDYKTDKKKAISIDNCIENLENKYGL